MILVINESTFLLNELKKQKNIDFKKLSFVSSKGFLFNYSYDRKIKQINLSIKDSLLIKYLKNFDKKENLIIVASDHDPAGHLISLEILSLFEKSNVLRFQYPFEKLFQISDNSFLDFLIRNSFDNFKIGIAETYLKRRFFNKDFEIKRINTLAALKNGSKVKKIILKGEQ